MDTGAEAAADMDAKPQRNMDELHRALHTAEENRRTVKTTKKTVVAGYNETLKDIESEITEILDQMKELGVANGTEK